jgi:hypothetical protein
MNGGDFYWPWAMELALFGIPDTDILSDAKSFIIDAIKKGELGFFEWPMKGEVLNMMQLGQDLYAYGTDGVCSATPQQFGDAVAHMTLNKSKIGVADKGAVWGDKDEAMHFYVDKKAHLRMVNPQQISDLMYQGELEDMVTNVATEPIIMSYDPDEGDLYICTATRARTYTKNSMGQPKQVITSIINDEGEAIAVKYNAPEYSQRNRIITSPFDFEERMSKFIHDMELGIYDVTNCRARVWYKDDNSTNWRPGEWHNLFTGGFLSPDISGFDFKLEVEYDAGSNFRFEYIRVNYQQRDERNFRIHQRRY